MSESEAEAFSRMVETERNKMCQEDRKMGRAMFEWSEMKEEIRKAGARKPIGSIDQVKKLKEEIQMHHPHDTEEELERREGAWFESLYHDQEFYDDVNGGVMDKQKVIEARRLEMKFFHRYGRMDEGTQERSSSKRRYLDRYEMGGH